MNTIYVSVWPEETRMGMVEGDQLRDYAVERNSTDNLVGNVYRARVSNVVPGIQAAFVDLNTGKNGFLTLKKGEKLSEDADDAVRLEYRTDGTDAFDSLFIGCKYFLNSMSGLCLPLGD